MAAIKRLDKPPALPYISRMLRILLPIVLTLFTSSTPVSAKEPVGYAQFKFPHIIRQDGIELELFPRPPNQIAAFYEARGFPPEMIDILKQQCYITVRIHNRRDDIVWLELDNWSFSIDGKPVQRSDRGQWKRRWQKMGTALNHQSTFRWSLLPETLDYLPDERESGNIILPRRPGNISIQASFATGKDKQGKPIHIHYDKLQCAQNP